MRVTAAVLAYKYEWQDEPTYSIQRYGVDHEGDRKHWAATEYVYICDVEVEFEELSPGVYRARQIDGLRVKKATLRDEFTKQSGMVEDRIQNLLAITDESHEG
jgi:hypothetical protein